MVQIGISYNPSLDLFLNGTNETALVLTDLFKQVPNSKIFLVDVANTDKEWWDDFPRIQDVTLSKLYLTRDLDVLIDINGNIYPGDRTKAAKKSIVFLRNFVQFYELDNSIYPEKPYTPRDFSGVTEIWCWDILNPKDTLDSIQTILPCPIKTVPFIWSPLVTDHYINLTKDTPKINNTGWEIHISEKNKNNTSSAVFPIVAARELASKPITYFGTDSIKFIVHNMNRIKDNKFFVENIYNNVEVEKLPIEFIDKKLHYEWYKSNSILFSHSRFIPISFHLLTAIWMGIPIVHNSPLLKTIHPVLNSLFYYGNRVSEICNAFKYFTSNPSDYLIHLSEIKQIILDKWSVTNNISSWNLTLSNILNTTINKSLQPIQLSKMDAPKIEPDKITIKNPTNNITIAFSDMWPGFNFNNNFVTDALRNECKLQNYNLIITGCKYESSHPEPSLLIFGPYSKDWKNVPKSVPRVYFSGENWPITEDDSIDLYITSSRTEDDKHIRIPTWLTFIDWFSGLTTLPENCQDNPIRIPLHFAMNSHPISFKDRKDFCAFVVSNPICQFRNETFKEVNNYKKVNSGGALYNNIGGQLSLKYPGGGCGDISKYHFFSQHKFTISFENSQADGYLTEKLLHSKMAGCIPIYWGDKNADLDFVKNSFINVSNTTQTKLVIDIIKKLESNEEICNKIASTPILDNEKKENALKLISNMAQKMLTLCGRKTSPKQIEKTFIINLDSRKDRWDNLLKAEPFLNEATRISAVNGKTLVLNDFIYKLFKNNQFHWKKAVIGCFLSHVKAWSTLINEDGNFFMILEDDVRFNKGWTDTWNKAVEYLPKDAELIYLGGVLPPNKEVLPSCLENINKYWSIIKPNNYFSPLTPLPIFHLCAYSYILTKQGAQKLLNHLQNFNADIDRISELDHFLGSMSVGLKKYILNPFVTQCFQDSDPNYLSSQFNNTLHINKFDSDIWNTTDCFSDEEISNFIKSSTKKRIIYHLNKESTLECYEHKWLEEIFEMPIEFVPFNTPVEKTSNDSWFLVQRPHLEKLNSIFNLLDASNISFKVLHLSDEFLSDNIDFYKLKNCKAVIRNYIRKDVPDLPHIITIPLGFHYKGDNVNTFDKRNLVWSFHGTDWFDRKKSLENLSSFVPNNCHFTNSWDDPKKTKEGKYISTLNNSKFCPILRGNNFETFRLYEALETGTIPLYVRADGDDSFWSLITSKLELLPIESWLKAKYFIKLLLDKPEYAEKYRQVVYQHWIEWKNEIKTSCKKLI